MAVQLEKIEHDPNQNTLKFTMETPEFDADTYWGRFEAFRATANPFNAFNTNQKISDLQALLAA